MPAKNQWDFGELFPTEAVRRVLSVSELTGQLKRLLEKQVGEVTVAGEVTNLRAQASGHIYFTLKDADAQLACVLFRHTTTPQRARLQDGQRVLLTGDVTVVTGMRLEVPNVEPHTSGTAGILSGAPLKKEGADHQTFALPITIGLCWDDRDNDGVADAQDKCPDKPETKNDYQDDDGCPDTVPEKLKVFAGAIRGIEFKTGSAKILPTSFKVLKKAAGVLKKSMRLPGA